MKTTKTLCTAILVLATLSIFAQEERGLFVTVEYSPELNRFETWVSHVYERFNHNSNEAADLPVVSRSYYAEYAEISYDNGLTIENWMITPFDEVILESDLLIEEWMTTSIEVSEGEKELCLEGWMTEPLWE